MNRERLIAYLENPVEWTKENGQGPTVFLEGDELIAYLASDERMQYYESYKTLWKQSATTMEPRKNDLKKIFSTVNSAFTDVKGPLPGHYDEIRAPEYGRSNEEEN